MLVFKGKLDEHPRLGAENELYIFFKRASFDRLGWDVEAHLGLERDSFDKPDTHWVLIEDEQGLCGCIRLLNCAQDYMLPSIFPDALAGKPAVCGVGIRFHLDERFARAVDRPLWDCYEPSGALIA